MNRKLKSDLTRVNEHLKLGYHNLSEIICTVEGGSGKIFNVRLDKVRNAFLLIDLAVSEINETLGKNRSD